MRQSSARHTPWLFLFLLVLWTSGGVAHSPLEESICYAALTQNVPPRARLAMTGSAFVRYVASMHERQREQAILAQLLAGNVPDFLRTLQPVRLGYTYKHSRTITATICVMPDYLAIGSDDDFIRIPMNLLSATAVAAHFDFILPTPKMVDAIYAQAAYHLQPEPMTPGQHMRSTAYYQRHNGKITQQRLARHIPLGALVAGHKKDLVLTNRLAHRHGRLAIYGWHRRVGMPIQPLSTVHGAHYADYSHGIRLISTMVLVDGQPWSIYKVLQHRELAKILSTEGTLFPLHQLFAIPSTLQVVGLDPF